MGPAASPKGRLPVWRGCPKSYVSKRLLENQSKINKCYVDRSAKFPSGGRSWKASAICASVREKNSTFVLQGMASILVNTYHVVKRTKNSRNYIRPPPVPGKQATHNLLCNCARYFFLADILGEDQVFLFFAFLSCELLEGDNLVLAGAKNARTIKLQFFRLHWPNS